MKKKNKLREMAQDVLQSHIGTFQFQLVVDGNYDAIIDAFMEYTQKRLTLLGVNEVEFCTCGNPSGEGNIQMVNDEEMLFFCCDCGKQVQN